MLPEVKARGRGWLGRVARTLCRSISPFNSKCKYALTHLSLADSLSVPLAFHLSRTFCPPPSFAWALSVSISRIRPSINSLLDSDCGDTFLKLVGRGRAETRGGGGWGMRVRARDRKTDEGGRGRARGRVKDLGYIAGSSMGLRMLM